MLNPPTDAASQFPDIKVLTRLLFSIKEDSIAKKKTCRVHRIYQEFGCFVLLLLFQRMHSY